MRKPIADGSSERLFLLRINVERQVRLKSASPSPLMPLREISRCVRHLICPVTPSGESRGYQNAEQNTYILGDDGAKIVSTYYGTNE